MRYCECALCIHISQFYTFPWYTLYCTWSSRWKWGRMQVRHDAALMLTIFLNLYIANALTHFPLLHIYIRQCHCLSFYLKIFEQKERQWHCLSLMLKFSKLQPEGEGDDSAPPWKEGQTRTCSFQQQPMPTPTGKQFQKCILQILIDHLLPLCQAVLVSQDQDPASIWRFQVCHVKSIQTEANLN